MIEMSRREALVYGRRACLAVAARRPDTILRVFYLKEGRNRDLAPLLKRCAERRRPYREVSADELAHISKSAHHEGVVVVTHPARSRDLEDYLEGDLAQGSQQSSSTEDAPRLPIWVALDRVNNDHNRGAIARSLAWFGSAGLIWEGRAPQLSGSALRVAQGGAEEINLITVPRLAAALTRLRERGVLILGADQHEGGEHISALARPPALTSAGVCWVMGSEQHGLSPELKSACDALVMIPGSGLVESLNVSVSAGVLIAQSYGWLSAMRSDRGV